MARKIDIAWAAGLFEGEGSCFVSTTQRQSVVVLAMTDEDVVRRFAKVIGRGNVRAYASSDPAHAAYWQWSVQGADDVIAVLNVLLPWLGKRRSQRAHEVLQRAREIVARRGHCKNGHDLSDPIHLYLHEKTGKRHCRTCRREYRRGWTPRLAR